MLRVVSAVACLLAICPITAFSAENSSEGCPQRDGRPVAREDFHLYLLIGQSNMAGRGKMTPEDRQPVAGVYSLDAKGTWIPAAHPLHFDKPKAAGVGLGLDFALAMQRETPNATIGLIPSAFGGTRLDEWEKGDKLYENAVKRVKTATQCGVLKGVLWHQGEGDSKKELAPTYGARLAKMIASLRADLGDENLPIVVGEMGRFRIPAPTSLINAHLNDAAEQIPRVRCASSAELNHNGDSTHFDAASLKEFGRRYAEQMLECQRQPADASETISK
jgi:hypothetical protein